MNKLVKAAIKGIENNLKTGQHLAPVMLIVNKKKEVTICPIGDLYSLNSNTKRLALQTILDSFEAIEYALVTEAWLSVNIPPKDNPDGREEIVMITYENRFTRVFEIWWADLHRHGDEAWAGKFSMRKPADGAMTFLFEREGDYEAPKDTDS